MGTVHVAGLSAGAASTLVTYPMENLRTHVSLGRKGGYVQILSDIYKERVRCRLHVCRQVDALLVELKPEKCPSS